MRKNKKRNFHAKIKSLKAEIEMLNFALVLTVKEMSKYNKVLTILLRENKDIPIEAQELINQFGRR